MVGILSIGVSLYENHRESATAEGRRQEEIRVLRDISGQSKRPQPSIPRRSRKQATTVTIPYSAPVSGTVRGEKFGSRPYTYSLVPYNAGI
jgi:hypothetical protein